MSKHAAHHDEWVRLYTEDDCTLQAIAERYGAHFTTVRHLLRRRGVDTSYRPETRPLEDRYWEKVDRRGPDECWPWTAGTNSAAYGQLRVGDRMEQAHRVGYELAHGPIPDGLYVCHTCDDRLCQNPAHHFLGTHGDNMDDKLAKGRQHRPTGALHGRAVLTPDAVREIRASTDTRRVLAERYGVSKAAIGDVQKRRSWAHV